MTRVAVLAVLAVLEVVVVIDDGRHVIPRRLECLTTAVGEPVTLHLSGDSVFADGFESGGAALWAAPPEPCDG